MLIENQEKIQISKVWVKIMDNMATGWEEKANVILRIIIIIESKIISEFSLVKILILEVKDS